MVELFGDTAVGRKVDVEQISSDFLFGANLFKLGEFETEALNQRYADAFTGLFNAATVPVYWAGLEPRRGHPRFAVDSEPVYRRPPPDVTVAFCEEHGLNMNGHCLVWDSTAHSIPDWWGEVTDREAEIQRRIREIAERYGNRIQRWDVVNEASTHRMNHLKGDGNSTGVGHPFPQAYEHLAFRTADLVIRDQ